MELKNHERGFSTHDDCRLAFGGTDHTDPGPWFPKDHLLALVKAQLDGELPGGIMLPSHGDKGEIVRYWQRLLNETGAGIKADGTYGDSTAKAVSKFWTSVGGEDFHGRSITSAVAMRLQQQAIGRGPEGPEGPAGPPATFPAAVTITGTIQAAE